MADADDEFSIDDHSRINKVPKVEYIPGKKEIQIIIEYIWDICILLEINLFLVKLSGHKLKDESDK